MTIKKDFKTCYCFFHNKFIITHTYVNNVLLQTNITFNIYIYITILILHRVKLYNIISEE